MEAARISVVTPIWVMPLSTCATWLVVEVAEGAGFFGSILQSLIHVKIKSLLQIYPIWARCCLNLGGFLTPSLVDAMWPTCSERVELPTGDAWDGFLPQRYRWKCHYVRSSRSSEHCTSSCILTSSRSYSYSQSFDFPMQLQWILDMLRVYPPHMMPF